MADGQTDQIVSISGDDNNSAGNPPYSSTTIMVATTTSNEPALPSADVDNDNSNNDPAISTGPAHESSPTATTAATAVAQLSSSNTDAISPNTDKDKGEALTDVSADEDLPEHDNNIANTTSGETPNAIVSSSKKSRPVYKYDPDKITLRFLFANRDGLAVTVECKPSDTVGEVKGALLSVWPEDLPVKVSDLGGDNLRLICMGKGYLMPDTRTLEDCQVPVFKTHPTPINVSIKPQAPGSGDDDKNAKKNRAAPGDNATGSTTAGSGNAQTTGPGGTSGTASQGCCVIL